MRADTVAEAPVNAAAMHLCQAAAHGEIVNIPAALAQTPGANLLKDQAVAVPAAQATVVVKVYIRPHVVEADEAVPA